MEPLSHLVVYIKRRICDDASAWFRLSFVWSFLLSNTKRWQGTVRICLAAPVL